MSQWWELGRRKGGGVKDGDSSGLWAFCVTWILDKADRWKCGGAESRIPELSAKRDLVEVVEFYWRTNT